MRIGISEDKNEEEIGSFQVSGVLVHQSDWIVEKADFFCAVFSSQVLVASNKY